MNAYDCFGASLWSLTLSLFLSKGYMIHEVLPLQKFWDFVWTLSLFAGDLAFLLIYAYSFTLIYPAMAARNKTIANIWAGFLIVTVTLAIACMDSLLLAYYHRTSALMDWETIYDFLKEFKAAIRFIAANSSMLVVYFWLHALGISLVVAIGHFHSQIASYIIAFMTGKSPRDIELVNPIYDPISQKEDYPSPLASALSRLYRRRLHLLKLGVIAVYAVIALCFRSQQYPWNQLARNILYDAVVLAVPWPHTSLLAASTIPGDLNACKTISMTIDRMRQKKNGCPRRPPPSFNFLRRTPKSQIKNIVWLFLESSRGDVVPFNYTSEWAKQHLTEKAFDSKSITPFFSEFVKHGVYAPHGRTVSSYTIKATIGALCGVFPLLVNGIKEHDRDIYRPCLPQLLQKNGFDTVFMQPAYLTYDHQDTMMEKVGFRKSIGRDEAENGAVKGNASTFEDVNYFGFEDNIFVEPILDWAEERASNNTPFMLTYITNVAHDPYNTPKHWPTYEFAKDDHKINKYLNAVRYVDFFLQKLMYGFAERNLLKDTLFVIMGDHGIALQEHKRFGTNENPAEQLFHIPIFFFTGNEAWNKEHPPIVLNETWSGLDIVPTIMETLNDEMKADPTSLIDFYEGQSILKKQNSRLFITLTNPGYHSLVIKDGNRKIVMKKSGESVAYDLGQDPGEAKPIAEDEAKVTFKDWMAEMKQVGEVFKERIYDLYKWQP